MNFINTIYLLEGIKREGFSFFLLYIQGMKIAAVNSVQFISPLFKAYLLQTYFLSFYKKKIHFIENSFLYTQEKPHFLELHIARPCYNVLNYKTFFLYLAECLSRVYSNDITESAPIIGFLFTIFIFGMKKKSIFFLEGIKKEKRNTLFITRNGNWGYKKIYTFLVLDFYWTSFLYDPPIDICIIDLFIQSFPLTPQKWL